MICKYWPTTKQIMNMMFLKIPKFGTITNCRKIKFCKDFIFN